MAEFVSSPSVLLAEPNALIHLGDAPDGLPLALSVVRERDTRPFLGSLAKAVEQPSGGPFAEELDEIATRIGLLLRKHALRQRLWSDSGEPGAPLAVYVTKKEITQVLGSSLMSKILRKSSPLTLPRSSAAIVAPARDEDTKEVRFQSDELQSSGATLRFHGKRRTCIAVPLEGGEPVLARFIGADIPLLDRPTVFESLSAFADARFLVKNVSFESRGFLSNVPEYLRCLERAEQHPQGGAVQTFVSISRSEVALRIRDLVRRVGRLHGLGLVHGDLKPSNILVTEREPLPIDSLDIPIGQRTPACTMGWAAPEQVIGKPVSPASDVYALALHICILLGGVVYGRLVEYVAAVGEGERRKFSFYDSPEVYLDRDLLRVPKEGIPAWQGILQRCFSLEPDVRPRDAREFAERLDDLLERFPPQGSVEFDLGCPGRHVRVLYPEEGERLTRVIEDRPL